MQAGTLRHRLILQHASETQDAYGETLKTWGTLATVWGSVEPLRMREYLEAQQTQAQGTHRITVRYREGLTPLHRVLHRERVFEVVAVLNPEERREMLHFLAVERVGDGPL